MAEDSKSADEDGRRGRRRIQARSIGAYPGVSPGLVIAVKGEPLPGEDAPLVAQRGRRKPITPQEALGVWRRKKRGEIAKEVSGGDEKVLAKLARKGLPAEAEARVPAELPAWDSKKVPVTMRLHPTLRAMVDALGELEGTNFATEVELALWKLIRSAPRDPDEVRRELKQMFDDTLQREWQYRF
jgi:hypothetical protein